MDMGLGKLVEQEDALLSPKSEFGYHTTTETEINVASTEKREDSYKKALLSSALQGANEAVSLDKLQNYEGAVEAYMEVLMLLQQVISQPGDENEKQRLYALVNFILFPIIYQHH